MPTPDSPWQPMQTHVHRPAHPASSLKFVFFSTPALLRLSCGVRIHPSGSRLRASAFSWKRGAAPPGN
jgi:hypothetical protein